MNDPAVYNEISGYRRFPDGLFTGSDALKSELLYAMTRKRMRNKTAEEITAEVLRT